MSSFFAIAFALGLLVLGIGLFLRANPADLAKSLRRTGGVLLLVIAGLLILTGRFAILGLPVGLLGAAILMRDRLPGVFARSSTSRGRSTGRAQRSGPASTVRTAYFEMELDHSSGTMEGRVLVGPFEGRLLSTLSEPELAALYSDVANAPDDPDSLSLIETYLDGVRPGWREDFHAHDAAGHGAAARSGPVTEEEAYEILGLTPGADDAAIRAAHRRLILRLHPDRGGSTALAAKINEAKDFLLRKHSSGS
ncbi:MAG: DnaJ domain-containing protein [Pseudomonadota bacterium]